MSSWLQCMPTAFICKAMFCNLAHYLSFKPPPKESRETQRLLAGWHFYPLPAPVHTKSQPSPARSTARHLSYSGVPVWDRGYHILMRMTFLWDLFVFECTEWQPSALWKRGVVKYVNLGRNLSGKSLSGFQLPPFARSWPGSLRIPLSDLPSVYNPEINSFEIMRAKSKFEKSTRFLESFREDK